MKKIRKWSKKNIKSIDDMVRLKKKKRKRKERRRRWDESQTWGGRRIEEDGARKLCEGSKASQKESNNMKR